MRHYDYQVHVLLSQRSCHILWGRPVYVLVAWLPYCFSRAALHQSCQLCQHVATCGDQWRLRQNMSDHVGHVGLQIRPPVRVLMLGVHLPYRRNRCGFCGEVGMPQSRSLRKSTRDKVKQRWRILRIKDNKTIKTSGRDLKRRRNRILWLRPQAPLHGHLRSRSASCIKFQCPQCPPSDSV